LDVRLSSLDNETLVIQIDKGDTGKLTEVLDRHENGFAVMGEDITQPFAVIDARSYEFDWFTPNHLLAIEAHELGHIRMNSCEESVAELEGIRLLEEAGHFDAADILKERGIV